MPESIALRRSFTALHRLETATHHADILKDSGTKQFLHMDILNTMLAVVRVEIWKEAVMASTLLNDAIFHVFDRFICQLLNLIPLEPNSIKRLISTLDWTEKIIVPIEY